MCQVLFDTTALRFLLRNILPIGKRKPAMDFEQECLNAHNECRGKHGVGPLKLNPEMSKTSQYWAEELMKRGTLEHSPGNKFGENIYCIQSSNVNYVISGNEPVDSWYKENELYVYGYEPYDLSAGHFTQIIWKTSTDLGVGMVKTNGRTIVICNYYPPGNIVGEFKHNVPPKGGFVDVGDIGKAVSKITIESARSDGDPFQSESRKEEIKKTKHLQNSVQGDFKIDFVCAHNEYRFKHGVPYLALDDDLCKYAQEWADALAARNVLEHRKHSPYGENIYCMYSSDPNFRITGHTPVDTWYEEKKEHQFGKEPTTLKTGHFTQVVWKSSRTLGVGWAKSRQGYIYVVANYHPAGNFVGEYVKNVPDIVDDTKPQPILSYTQHSESVSAMSLVTVPDGIYTQFQLDALKVHNEFRRKHGVVSLKLNKELCDFAKSWASECAKTKQMSHRPNNKFGENIFSMYSSDFSHEPSARDVVKKWYDEIEAYSFGGEKINFATLHFSQVVWRGSIEMGIDMAKNEKGYTYVVANYKPRGNVVGQFVSNVPAPKAWARAQWSTNK